jgi:hypothetical protein
LDPDQTSLSVVQDDLAPLALVNKVGISRRVFPTFVMFLQSFAFRDQGPGMVWDVVSPIWCPHVSLIPKESGGLRL